MERTNQSSGVNLAKGRASGKNSGEEGPVIGASVIEALRDGDHTAFDRVFIVYYNRVKGFVGSLVKNADDTEDIVSDVFAALWVNREKLDPSRNFNSFLYTSSKNAVLNYFRRNKVRSNYAAGAVKEDDSLPSDEEFIARETELLIKLTVSQMPAQRQKVFLMNREQGLDNSEIAAQLGITQKAVEKHMRLALADIRKAVTALLVFLSI